MTLDPKDFFDWIRQQPDDRSVNMKEANNKNPCGCLLVQYGRHLNLNFTLVGYDTIGFGCNGEDVHEFYAHGHVSDFIKSSLQKEIKTFKEAKELL